MYKILIFYRNSNSSMMADEVFVGVTQYTIESTHIKIVADATHFILMDTIKKITILEDNE